jgi:hypothetical protein
MVLDFAAKERHAFAKLLNSIDAVFDADPTVEARAD